uniref:Uncharacterized protein n=1 Tax=viral metagenome TaxID=1070528 RepID=A0A6C0AX57_9ZZZZ|tara:strand:- start:82285 stop:83088 length:804 start_codon:yes stop_codon:yes gene_type:complete
MNQISKNNIQNTDNYNKKFQDLPNIIFIKYITLINDYLKHCLDNIFIQNQTYYIYIIKKGITTINNVFKLLLMYTKNLEITYTNCQKSYVYYIEFIGQIGEDNNSFLQLNSKDATLFVYKKTIFDINNDVRKDYISDNLSNQLLGEVDSLIEIYNTILYKLINQNSIINIIKIINTDLQNVMQKLIKIYLEKNTSNGDIISNKIQAILIFSINFKQNNLIDYLDIFIKKLKKKNIVNIQLLKQYLLQDELYHNISPVKYINNIINQI